MIKGGCLCGKIRYEFKQEDVISAGNCHCKDCQKATGGGKATIAYIPSKSLKINEDYKVYSVVGHEGSNVTEVFVPIVDRQLLVMLPSNPMLNL